MAADMISASVPLPPPAFRFLIRIEEGYPNNPYHCRTHAADVLRSLHVVLNRGGVLRAVTQAAQARRLVIAEDAALAAAGILHPQRDPASLDLSHVSQITTFCDDKNRSIYRTIATMIARVILILVL